MQKKQRNHILERAIHRLTFARETLMDANQVRLLLDGLGQWSRAHQDGNGEKTETEIRKAVDKACQNLENLLDGNHTAHDRMAQNAQLASPDPLEKNDA